MKTIILTNLLLLLSPVFGFPQIRKMKKSELKIILIEKIEEINSLKANSKRNEVLIEDLRTKNTGLKNALDNSQIKVEELIASEFQLTEELKLLRKKYSELIIKPTESINTSSQRKPNSISIQKENATPIKKSTTTRNSYTRRYYRGPRGGCYYINGNGNKTYVDRSMCN